MAGAGGEELGHTREDSITTPSTSPVIEGSPFSFVTQQNGTVNSHLSRNLQLDIDPKESLSSLRSKASITAMLQLPDYDVVYQMLQERERDLELAARLGQALVQRNEMLEADLSAAVDLRQQHEHKIAQLKHDLVKKEALVQLYLEDVNERENQLKDGSHPFEGEGEPSWVKELAEECQQLRESNELLHQETERLRKETSDIEQKEKDVLQLCLDQLTATKQNLGGLRQEVEQRSIENLHLRVQLDELTARHRNAETKLNSLLIENEDLKEKLFYLEASNVSLINEKAELQHTYEQHMEEKQSEIQRLKEMSGCRSAPSESSDGSESYLGAVEHESIVHEIEEALRKEIIAASTLTERPRSPNHYAQQRTMVVMETVRAATMATSKRRERLKTEQDQKDEKDDILPSPQDSKGRSELAVPSANHDSRGYLTPPKIFSPLLRNKFSPSSSKHQRPVMSKNSSSPLMVNAQSTPESLPKQRNHMFFSPEKLQIVKPLEGSVTLLRWRLLASPQLGGAKSYFSAVTPPGVLVKGWTRAEIDDNGSSSLEANASEVSLSSHKQVGAEFTDLNGLEEFSETLVTSPLTSRNHNKETFGLAKRGVVVTPGGLNEAFSPNDSDMMNTSFN